MTSPAQLFQQLDAGPGPTRLGGLRALDTDIDTTEGAVIVAVDLDGTRHLLVPVPMATTGPADLGAAVSIRVRTLTDMGSDRRFVDVACTEPRLQDLFDIVIAEMLAAVGATPGGEHRRVCQRVLDRWRQLLRRVADRLLGPEQLAGLAAELWWLNRVAAVRPDRALPAWHGPNGAPHDLVGPGLDVEVKAVGAARRVEIHGADQLEPPIGGELYLAAVHLGPAEPGNHITVPDLVDRLTGLGVDTVDLLTALARAGYDHAEREAYESTAWTILLETIHRVEESFPRVTPSTAPYSTHPAVSNVCYTLALDHCPRSEDIEPSELATRLAATP